MTRAVFDSDYDSFPMNNLVAGPLLRLAFPNSAFVTLPLSGTYLRPREVVFGERIADDWAFDISADVTPWRTRSQ